MAETHTQAEVIDPTADQEIATKKYVDDNAGGTATEVSRTITIPNGAMILDGATESTSGVWGMISFRDGYNDKVHFQWTRPIDFHSIELLEIYWKSASSGTAVWAFNWAGGGSGEDKDSNNGNSGFLSSTNTGADKITYKSHVPNLSAFLSGDIIGFNLTRAGSNEDDDLADSAELLGISIRYKSDET